MYELRIMPSAEKYFKKIKEKPLKLAFKNAIDKILNDPYIGEPKTGDLAGFYCYDVFYKGSNYELAYIIKEIDYASASISALAEYTFKEQNYKASFMEVWM